MQGARRDRGKVSTGSRGEGMLYDRKAGLSPDWVKLGPRLDGGAESGERERGTGARQINETLATSKTRRRCAGIVLLNRIRARHTPTRASLRCGYVRVGVGRCG